MTPVTLDIEPATLKMVADWRDLEVEVGRFGADLDRMKTESGLPNGELSRLSSRYEKLAQQVVALKEKSFDQMLDSADADAQPSTSEMIVSAAEEMSQKITDGVTATSQQLSEKANEVGTRLSLATKKVGRQFTRVYDTTRWEGDGSSTPK